MPEEIFFGTGNEKKLKEIQELLGNRFRLKSFHDLPSPLFVEETEDTLEGNAILKAKAFFAATHIPCFADDTGLEVAALDNRPGVFSARYAGEDGNAEKNIDKLLLELKGEANRSARFRTVIAMFDGKEIRTFEGVLSGTILNERKGQGGFGYDPVFLPENSEKSLAELSAEEKNAISHRGNAVRKFVEFLTSEKL